MSISSMTHKAKNRTLQHYMETLEISGKELATRAGVSHSQVHEARTSSVGPDNAERIASYIARRLALLEEEKLELKAEIMGDPSNLVRAYLGSGLDAARLFGVSSNTGAALVEAGGIVRKRTADIAAETLEGMGAPAKVIEEVRAKGKTLHGREGHITNTQRGREATDRRGRSMALFSLHKPTTAAAIKDSGLSRREIYEQARISREALRLALHDRCSRATAEAIAAVLAGELALSDLQKETIVEELTTAPSENF